MRFLTYAQVAILYATLVKGWESSNWTLYVVSKNCQVFDKELVEQQKLYNQVNHTSHMGILGS